MGVRICDVSKMKSDQHHWSIMCLHRPRHDHRSVDVMPLTHLAHSPQDVFSLLTRARPNVNEEILDKIVFFICKLIASKSRILWRIAEVRSGAVYRSRNVIDRTSKRLARKFTRQSIDLLLVGLKILPGTKGPDHAVDTCIVHTDVYGNRTISLFVTRDLLFPGIFKRRLVTRLYRKFSNTKKRTTSLFSGSPTGDRALEPVEVPR